MFQLFSPAPYVCGLITIASCLCTSRALAAAPTPISACGTISSPGNYILTQGLVATTTCITITVDNVVIDLNNHRILGSGTHSAGSGITDGGNAIHNTIIANGRILGFVNGINFTNTSSYDNAVDNVALRNNLGDAIFMASADQSITNIRVKNNGGNGIHIGECCNTFVGITAFNNGGDGILLDSGESMAADVDSEFNGVNGIELGGGDNFVDSATTLRNGSLSACTPPACGEGILLSSGDNMVRDSISSRNIGDGIDVGTDGLIDHTNATNNGMSGVLSFDGGVIVSNGKFNTNGGAGLNLNSTGQVLTGNVATKNQSSGAIVKCPSVVVRLNATGNGSPNLSETGGGNCSNLNNKAP